MADGAHDLLGWIARAVGLFYLLGGVLTVRAGRTETFLDDAIARIGGEPTDPAERLRGWSMMAIGLLTAASGLLLVLLLKAAVYAFLANAAWQGAYLVWARRALPPDTPLEALGRRRSVNAFLVWLVLTALVMLLFQQGVLT
ncbi:MAG: hypothetical protein Q7U20_05240 [Caulobacter sp.]|nr:hypothetical protein [Caulobacter sp.]